MKALEMFSLEGKVAFVTGAGQGIGKQLARGLAEAGAKVAIADINFETAEASARELSDKGYEAAALKVDVTDVESVDAMVKAIVEKWGRLDIALNNAGGGCLHKAEELPKEEFMRVCELNMGGVFLCSKAAAIYMMEHGGGSIINIASMSAHIVNTPQTISVYNASKAGVEHLTKSLAVEWAKYGVRVNSISPGYMMTELTATIKDMHPIWNKMIPMGRIGDPSELIGAAIYLASDASVYATGTDIIVDGGYTCL